MKKYFRYLILALALALSVIAAGCGAAKETAQPEKPIKVGVTAGPHAEIMDIVKKIAEKDGLKIEIIEFNDYMAPNVALDQGEIDANSFQHQPFLDNHIKERGFKLTSIGKTVIFPLGIYSAKIKHLADLQPGAVVAVPNDPTNGGRALAVLEKSGLIKLRPGAGLKATAADIVDNPKKLKVKELDAALIPRALNDIDIAAINTSYALKAGLVPTRDAVAIEDSSSPYANILVVHEKNKDNPVFKKLLKAFQSEEVKQFLKDHFQGSAVPAW